MKLLFVATAAALALTACETTSTAPSHAAVACEKCKTVWVPTTGPGKGGTAYQMTKRMTCHDCVSAVENYFKTGELKHTCATCGDALHHCTTH